MAYEIGLLPSGHLHCYWLTEVDTETPLNQQIAKAFSRHVGEGLFELGVKWKDQKLSSVAIYWQHFTTQYLQARCLNTLGESNNIAAIDSLDKNQTNMLLATIPPMQGAEYLSADALQNIWQQLDTWLRGQVKEYESFNAFLARKAPQ